MSSWRQSQGGEWREEDMFAYCLGTLCPVRFISRLTVGFRSLDVVTFHIHLHFWSMLTTAYSGLFPE